jgi:pimeloyl-ACP methyl ester carboxylesterase
LKFCAKLSDTDVNNSETLQALKPILHNDLKVIGTIQYNGCPLAYKVEGTGEPAVFIQGAGLHGDGWLPQTQALRDAFRCITFDNRGMGKSQPSGAAITVSQMAQDTLAVMDAAGIESAHLAGHSLGGAVALEIALTHPRRVRSLALLCTSARGSDATKPTFRMIWLGLRSRMGSRRMRSNAFLEIVMPMEYLAAQDRESLAERLQPLFGHALCDTPPVVMQQLSALRRFDATPRLGELAAIPTLVLSATEDIIFPPSCGKAIAMGIPSARYVEIPGTAHGVTIQSPETVNQLLLEHFGAVRVP